MKNAIKIGILGNPNCGKTTLFNALTGARQRVGNWPGVTVDKKTGFFDYKGKKVEVIDTPGIYSLSASSLDEKVARDFLISGEADIIVNIVDSSNLERNLYLTLQLIEMRLPLIVALNMMDVAKEKGVHVDIESLARELGCPVVPMVASKEMGIESLKEVLIDSKGKELLPTFQIKWPSQIETAIKKLVPYIDQKDLPLGCPVEWLAQKCLENDQEIVGRCLDPESVSLLYQLKGELERLQGDELDILIAQARYESISDLIKKTTSRVKEVRETLSDKIDRIVLNRILGIPVFLFAMYLMFLFVINIGGAFIDFFDILGGAIFVHLPRGLLSELNAPDWIKTIIADGIGGGIQTMATFIPPIGFMFLGLSFLEDSGYMARAAFVMDRFMQFLGLPGKSFIPMLVGFGCNVPAIMATRTLESKRDRILTILMAPFMSCGARLPVYALFAAAFFPHTGQNIVFLLYLLGIGAAVLTGLILKNTILKGEITPFLMELPPYHLPTFKSVFLKAYERLKTFLFRAGRILVPIIAVLAFLNSIGTDGSFGNENTSKSVLARIGQTITPLFSPMGITHENWPATVGIFTGIFAKEAVVGTLNSLYGSMDIDIKGQEKASSHNEKQAQDLGASIKEAFVSVPNNLLQISSAILDPLGIKIDTSNISTIATELEVNRSTFEHMKYFFGSTASAFAYLLFILLYFPCSAAIAAVYQETDIKWTIFTGAWTTFLAWSSATLFYQLATFKDHPGNATLWLSAIGALFSIFVVTLFFLGNRENRKRTAQPGAHACSVTKNKQGNMTLLSSPKYTCGNCSRCR